MYNAKRAITVLICQSICKKGFILIFRHKDTCSIKDFHVTNAKDQTGVKLDGKSIWKIHMDFFFRKSFFLNLF